MREKKVMKKISLLLRKCKSFSMELRRSSSYSNLRSNSAREHHFKARDHHHKVLQQQEQEDLETIFVGSTRKRYMINSKYLIHPLLKALMEKKTLNQQIKNKPGGAGDYLDHEEMILVKCEVVLFDHLLWLLDNTDPNLAPESLEELAQFYVY